VYSERVKPGVRVVVRQCLVAVSVVMVSFILFMGAAAAGDNPSDDTWHHTNADGEVVIDLYFVYSTTCPHCMRALPFIEELDATLPWLNVVWLQADLGDPEVERVALGVAAEIGENISGVPAFMVCNTMITGYNNAEGVGAEIVAELEACRDLYAAQPSSTDTSLSRSLAGEMSRNETEGATTTTAQEVAVPGIGTVSASSVPLPIFTVIVAGLDAFNPCAFFVLLFLLSLLVHARNRTRMAIVGFTFIAISGVLYFVFMAAWLNVFLVTGHLTWITAAAGAIAITVAMLNLKDYVRPGSKGSLSIPESAKPGMFARMRRLVSDDRFVPVLGATVALAVVANSYELLCTAGLPMVFTRVLTLADLSTPGYYGYLALYNLIYVIPLFGIVVAFVWTLGSRKLQPEEGRALKLLSGTMMLGLGMVLLFAPHLLEQVGVAIGILLGAVAVTAIVLVVDRRARRSTSHPA
jgi:thiol-disulfide isomerase/thioredoxin